MKKIVVLISAISLVMNCNQAHAYSKRDLADLKIYASLGSLLKPTAKAIKQLPGYDQLILQNSLKADAVGFTAYQLKQLGNFSIVANKVLSKAIEADEGIIAFVANCLEKATRRKQGDITSWSTGEAQEVGVDLCREILQKILSIASGTMISSVFDSNGYRWLRRISRTLAHSIIIAGVETGYFQVCKTTHIQPINTQPNDLRQRFIETTLFSAIEIGLFELLGEFVIFNAEPELFRSLDFGIDEILGKAKSDQSDHSAPPE